MPETKYTGTKFISELDIPLSFPGWNGKDITDSLNINYAESTFNFINDALGHQYINVAGRNLIFIILDAGNLHNPQVCFTSAGYTIKELEYTEFHSSYNSFRAHTLFTERGKESFLSFYWIVVDKKMANEWIEHKLQQLFFSLFNAKRVGLMVRIDIPANKDTIESATTLARDFVHDLSSALQPGKIEYIYGNK